MLRVSTLLLTGLLSAASASVPGLALAAYSVANPALAALPQDQRPKKLLLLPPQMFVGEISAGGVVQKQEDWTKQASENLLNAAESVLRDKQFHTLRLPKLDEASMEIVESHSGLYDRLALAIYIYGRGNDSAWKHRHQAWDYTLGDGLAFLRDKTGADTALFFIGTDLISSSGRKAAFAAGLFLGIVMPLGQSFITVGLADLKTGDIRWMSYDQSMSLDTREPNEAEKLLRDFFSTYPQP